MVADKIDLSPLSIEDQRREQEAARLSGVAEQSAVDIAISMIAWPCAAIIVAWFLIDSDARLIHLVAFFPLLIIWSLIAGSIVGWTAHRLFWQKNPLPMKYIVIVMSLIVDLTFLAWLQIAFISD